VNLHDPLRPTILHRPAFISGWHVIPRLQIWPKEDGKLELSLMLPILDQRFAGKWYTIECLPTELHDLIKEFKQDPEGFVLLYFDLEISKLDRTIVSPPIEGAISSKKNEDTTKNEEATTSSSSVLSVADLLGE
jgi:hypothetical protein